MKAFLLFALGMLLAGSALAQPPEKRNEVVLGIGDAGLLFMLDDVTTTIFTLGTVTYGDERGGVQVVAGYQRWFSRGTSAGVTATWAGAKKTMFFRGRSVGDVERRQMTLTVDGRAHWFRRPSAELYTGLALGVGAFSDALVGAPDENDTFLAFHLVPIGVRFGRDWAGFFETGFGVNGFVRAGVSRRL